MKAEDLKKFEKAGSITKQTVAFARTLVKKDMLLREIAEAIEQKIRDLGGRPAFPVNLSMNEIAAHATPSYEDTQRARGLLKVDLGVHVDGFVADTAFSLDLENSALNKQLIASAEQALAAALKVARVGVALRVIGKTITDSAGQHGFTPIRNLSGHSITEYDLHAGLTIPNYDNGDETALEEGAYAIEPFITNGNGMVRDGKLSGIYQLVKQGAVRDSVAREVLAYIVDEYQTLPFCSRWIHAKFGTRGLIALKRIEETGMLHHYAHLVESAGAVVAQAEHTILVSASGTTITTA